MDPMVARGGPFLQHYSVVRCCSSVTRAALSAVCWRSGNITEDSSERARARVKGSKLRAAVKQIATLHDVTQRCIGGCEGGYGGLAPHRTEFAPVWRLAGCQVGRLTLGLCPSPRLKTWLGEAYKCITPKRQPWGSGMLCLGDRPAVTGSHGQPLGFAKGGHPSLQHPSCGKPLGARVLDCRSALHPVSRRTPSHNVRCAAGQRGSSVSPKCTSSTGARGGTGQYVAARACARCVGSVDGPRSRTR